MRCDLDGRPIARRLLLGGEMQLVDAYAIEDLGVPGLGLMENAGRHVAHAAAELAPDGRVGVVCGRGNNGGDGFVAARHLVGMGRDVDVVLCADPSRLAGDAAANFAAVQGMRIPVRIADEPALVTNLPGAGRYAVLVDALLGTGVRGEVHGTAREAIAWMSAHGAPIVSVDVPSGLCADSGVPLGSAVRAALTVTFVTGKLGHWLHPAPAYVGRLRVVDIGMPAAAVEHASKPRHLLGDADLGPAFAPRALEAHKGTLGHLYVLGGSVGHTGAARMVLDAAMRAGVGLATLGTDLDALRLVGGQLYEPMCEVAFRDGEAPISAAERLAASINARSAAVLGPGMPTGVTVGQVVAELLPRLKVPAVLDADALNHLSTTRAAWRGGAAKVITPHPGEAARLLGLDTTEEVQADRVAAVEALAKTTGAVAVLKGAHTLVCAPSGALAVCPDGNPGMATGGMGDVLAGVIGALLARRLDPFAAACAGVLWHARAGDLAAERSTHNAVLARDVVAALAEVERRCSRD